MPKTNPEEPAPMVTDEERDYAAAVHEALTGDGKFPKGHEFEGMTKQEVVDQANEERQNPSSATGTKKGKAGQNAVAHVGEVQGATGASSKKDAAAKK